MLARQTNENHRVVGFLAISLALLIATPLSAQVQVMYTVVDLGTFPGGTSSAANAINASGQVTGSGQVSITMSSAFRVSPGETLNSPGANLGTLGGNTATGYSINALGQIAGQSNFSTGNTNLHAFRTTPTGNLSSPGADLGTFSDGLTSVGRGINALGQVAGYGATTIAGSPTTRAFRTTPTGNLSDPNADLGTFSGGVSSRGNAINSLGQVTGFADFQFGDLGHAFRTTATGRISDPGTDLGTLGGNQSQGFAINDAGQVVGQSRLAGNTVQHAFRTTATGLISDSGTDLGVLPGFTSSSAAAINNFGVVVGNVSDSSGLLHAFVYDTMMRDLNDLLILA